MKSPSAIASRAFLLTFRSRKYHCLLTCPSVYQDCLAKLFARIPELFGYLLGSRLLPMSQQFFQLFVLMEKRYGIKLASPAEGKAIFQSVRTIAEYVNENRKK